MIFLKLVKFKKVKGMENNIRVFDKSPVMLSPVNLVKHNSGFVGTPKTPRLDDSLSESKLESLPMDLLVCYGFCGVPNLN